MKRISMDPITRLEGHGKIEIFLDKKGNVENAYLQIPELRGFEQFSIGRPAENLGMWATFASMKSSAVPWTYPVPLPPEGEA